MKKRIWGILFVVGGIALAVWLMRKYAPASPGTGQGGAK